MSKTRSTVEELRTNTKGELGLHMTGHDNEYTYLLHKYELEEHIMVPVVEWQASTHHFIHYDTNTPPVHCSSIVIVIQNLTTIFQMHEFFLAC
jgi:hypothetical protein